MKTAHSIVLSAIFSLSIQPMANAQGMFESTGVRAIAPGLGAGLGASMGNSKVVKRITNNVQNAAVIQTQYIAHYLQTGFDAEKKSKWETAEWAYRAALSMIAHKDGPGSQASLPALRHLSKACEMQKKMDDAISFQKTVVALSLGAKKSNENQVLTELQNLSRLFVKHDDFKQAEPILRNSLQILQNNPSLPQQQARPTMEAYGRVLRKLNRDEEAVRVEKALASDSSPNLLYQALPFPTATSPPTVENPATVKDDSSNKPTHLEETATQKLLPGQFEPALLPFYIVPTSDKQPSANTNTSASTQPSIDTNLTTTGRQLDTDTNAAATSSQPPINTSAAAARSQPLTNTDTAATRGQAATDTSTAGANCQLPTATSGTMTNGQPYTDPNVAATSTQPPIGTSGTATSSQLPNGTNSAATRSQPTPDTNSAGTSVQRPTDTNETATSSQPPNNTNKAAVDNSHAGIEAGTSTNDRRQGALGDAQ